MELQQFIDDYSGIPENEMYIAQLILDEDVAELKHEAEEFISAYKALYHKLMQHGFELG